MSNGNARLGYDGKNGAGSAIRIVQSLIVYDESWGRREGDGRHWNGRSCCEGRGEDGQETRG